MEGLKIWQTGRPWEVLVCSQNVRAEGTPMRLEKPKQVDGDYCSSVSLWSISSSRSSSSSALKSWESSMTAQNELQLSITRQFVKVQGRICETSN